MYRCGFGGEYILHLRCLLKGPHCEAACQARRPHLAATPSQRPPLESRVTYFVMHPLSRLWRLIGGN
jgi:hypothetical protein